MTPVSPHVGISSRAEERGGPDAGAGCLQIPRHSFASRPRELDSFVKKSLIEEI